VIGHHVLANPRTLEQKISDAGPNNQRIDPHVLTDVRKRLVRDGHIAKLFEGGVEWFHLPDENKDAITQRLKEQMTVYKRMVDGEIPKRIGQCLEIAVFRALCLQNSLRHFGAFRNLDEHDDGSLYSKEEPPGSMDGKFLPGGQKLDFLVIHSVAGPAGIEVKNVRQWLYPNRDEIRSLLSKALALDCVPVLIARRLPFVTFKILGACGVLVHQTYNQLLPETESDLASKARDKNLLGYHDIRVGNQPDSRLLKFIGTNLPLILPQAREKFDSYKDLIDEFANGMEYKAFSARVRRRGDGTNEDYDYDQPPDDYI